MLKTDILYVVGKGFSDWRNNELRYSLRSIAKYGRNIGKVHIAGFVPYWINTDVVDAMPMKDETKNKHYNILRCIEKAVASGRMSERFLYSSDDHFYTRPTDFTKYPVYWRGTELPDTMPGKPRWYDVTLKSTHDCLAAFGLPTKMYAWHGNTWFDTRLFMQQRMELLRRLAQTMPEACEPSCLMLNYWQAISPDTMPRVVQRNDGKVGTADTIEDVQRAAKAKEVISGTDVAGAALRTWLQREFPKPCIYERDD